MDGVKSTATFDSMRWIPNSLTLGNALMGCLAIAFLSINALDAMSFCIGLALLFDLLDGWAARKLGVDGPLGVQLDSLADAISFGAFPGLLWFHVGIGWGLPWWFSLLGLLPIMASLYRLGRFNLGLAGTQGFIGIPTPANALFLLGVVWCTEETWFKLPEMAWTYGLYALISVWSAYSLNGPWPVMSFKDMPKGGMALVIRIMYALATVALLIILKMAAFAFIIPLLLLFSIIEHRYFKPKFA
jgi:CDP-diacylglycerol--serine O-phosphatidyltransferase